MTALLEVRHISQAYDHRAVLEDFSFTLNAGNIACLLGPSGCGKTTVLRCIAGFEPLTQGEIVLHGEIMSRPGLTVPTERRRIGMVFQDYALFPHLTVGRNISFGLHTLSEAERSARVAELLDIVGLQNVATRYPQELSGGQ
ncbi:MAG: ABC transporter ATP-binding protein, partial [Burkholderiales bacterium]